MQVNLNKSQKSYWSQKRELEIEIKKQQDNSLLKFAYETVYITKKLFKLQLAKSSI